MMQTLEQRMAEAEQQQKEFLENRGEFLKFIQGTNVVEFLDEVVEEGKYGWNYKVILNGKRGILTLKGVLERQILTALAQSKLRKVLVIRVGEGFDTRYSISAVNSSEDVREALGNVIVGSEES